MIEINHLNQKKINIMLFPVNTNYIFENINLTGVDTFKIYDVMGNLVLESNSSLVDVSGLASGV